VSLSRSWLFALALTSACAAFAPKGPTEVARGEYYSSGRPEFDGFFLSLHEKQVELLAAPSEPRAARERLASSVGLTSDASDEVLRRRLNEELRALAARGLRLRLDVPAPSATPGSATLFASATSVTSPLQGALSQEATRLVRVRDRMLATRAELAKLRVRAITLGENVESAFRTEGPWKREEVESNLDDGQKVIVLMESRAGDVEASASALLSLLASVAVTDPSLGQPVSDAPEPVEAPRSRRGSARGGHGERRPTPEASAARPRGGVLAPPPSRPSNEDDGGAQKPAAPGNAPAEIEP
jgi:hypothetical protein